MRRQEMLKILYSLNYCIIEPESSWSDIGFTEREIWVNSKGYGYILSDEPTHWGQVQGLEKEKWLSIRKKISDNVLIMDDIIGTSLVELLEIISYGDLCGSLENLNTYFESLLELPEQVEIIFAMDTVEGWTFFSTEEDFRNAFARDWCDIAWEELSDDILAEWIRRLKNEGVLR